MCIGIPMQVLRLGEGRAWCEAAGEGQWVDIRLVDPPAPGDWLLVFLGAARERISPGRAGQIRDALTALEAVSRGDTAVLDGLFADLVNREPQLPAHLQGLQRARESS